MQQAHRQPKQGQRLDCVLGGGRSLEAGFSNSARLKNQTSNGCLFKLCKKCFCTVCMVEKVVPVCARLNPIRILAF
jgi:hypothetical protein